MKKYQNNVTDRYGNAVASAQVTVNVSGGAIATIYADNAGTVKSNPFTTDRNGYIEFYAPDGRYDIVLANGGYYDVQIVDDLGEKENLSEPPGAGLVGYNGAETNPTDTIGNGLKSLENGLTSNVGASLVGYTQGGAGAGNRTLADKAAERVTLDDFGVTGVAAADTAALAAAIAAVPAGGVVYLVPGKTYQINSVNVTGKRITLIGFGATINCNGDANGAIYKTDHGNHLKILGVKFTGTGKAINYVTATSGTMFDDFEFAFCRFENADYGVYLDGAREGRIISCAFEGTSNKGIYRVRSVNTDVIAGFWKNTVYGVNDDGDGSPYSAGLKVIGGTMIGCGNGVLSQRSDYCVINGVMIDYCDNPVVFRGVDIGLIGGGCYITTRTTSPAILIDEHAGSATNCREIRIIGNAIASNTDDVTSDAVRINKLISGEVSSNSITFWWRTGIDMSACTNVKIVRNKINNDPGSTAPTKTAVLESATGSNTNVIADNEVNQVVTPISAQTARNSGYVTQARGEGVSGTGVSTLTVAHGLSYTPIKADIILTPTNAEAAGKNPYVSAVDATNITIGFTTATAAAAGVGWTAKRGGSLV